MKKVTVLGMGSWGSALAQVLADNGHQVTIWGNHQASVTEWNDTHTNQHYLPGVKFSSTIQATTDLKTAILHSQMLVVVVPTKAIREVMQQLSPIIEVADHPIIVSAAKGIEVGTHDRISEMIAQELKPEQYEAIAVLSGPSHAEEVALRRITTVTSASQSITAAKKVQDAFMNGYFRVYTNQDVVGVELGGALKNIIGIGAGIVDGLNLGDNVKASLITRGLAEITRLGVALGADPLTFMGLSGMGDLIVTCMSVHSRNFRAGRLFAKGLGRVAIQQEIGMVVEGIRTCKAAHELAHELGIEMPITEGLYQLIYKNASLEQGIALLMQREGTSEAALPDHIGELDKENM